MIPTTADKLKTPRRPLAISNGGHGVCPRCENLVSHTDASQCNRCGQTLKWPKDKNGGHYE